MHKQKEELKKIPQISPGDFEIDNNLLLSNVN